MERGTTTDLEKCRIPESLTRGVLVLSLDTALLKLRLRQSRLNGAV